MIRMLFLLIAGHFLCDYPLQGDFIGKFKNRHVTGCPVPWWHLLTAHAFIQAGMVLLVTGRMEFALIELLVHWLVDYAKCEGTIGINQDQAFHIACKVFYMLLCLV